MKEDKTKVSVKFANGNSMAFLGQGYIREHALSSISRIKAWHRKDSIYN